MTSELELARRERDRLERKIDDIHRKHSEAHRTARQCVAESSELGIELDAVNDKIRKLKP
jgi:hypothetical protein